MSPVKKTTKTTVAKKGTKAAPKVAKKVVKKSKAESSVSEISNINDVVKKAVVKREKAANPLLKEAKKDIKEFKGKYIEGVGRRKTSIARVRIYLTDTGFSINGKTLADYFKNETLQDRLVLPLRLTDNLNRFGVSIKVVGGGLNAQSDASCLGISRCLVKLDENNKKLLRQNDLLTRDSRIVERKKYGLHKARRAPQ
jgi:small subunit ribosomal protein S9